MKKGIKINLGEINVNNSFEMTKLLVKILTITKSLFLSETELYALTYFVINGYSKVSRESLITSKLLKNKNSEANLIHSFRKYGLIVKNNFGEELNKDFQIPLADVDGIKLEMLIKK